MLCSIITRATAAFGVVVAVALAWPPAAHANPVATWLLNINVVNASTVSAACSVPHNCDLTSPADRTALYSSFGSLQAAGKGKVEQEPLGFSGTPPSGFVYIVAQTDGSMTSVELNGRGLTCAPACDHTVSTVNASDHMIAYKITDTGSRSVGDMFPATFLQDTITIDTNTITIVAAPMLSVGGVAEQPDGTALPAPAAASGDHTTQYALGGSIALAVLSVAGASAWYVRRKRAA
jgi:hypothetical protein